MCDYLLPFTRLDPCSCPVLFCNVQSRRTTRAGGRATSFDDRTGTSTRSAAVLPQTGGPAAPPGVGAAYDPVVREAEGGGFGPKTPPETPQLPSAEQRKATLGEAPKKCSTFLGGFSHKIIITSTTPIVTPEFSSDLERAPGARSIADENSGVTFGVVELRRCEAYEHFRSHPVLLGTLTLPCERECV